VRLKSYHSATVESAIRLAHIELGDQAVFLGSRRNDAGVDPNQAYEVTFAVMEDAGGGQAASGEATARWASEPVPRAPHGSAAGPGGNVTTGQRVAPGQQVAPEQRAPARAAARVAAGADAGALVSWKKFLRQINTGGDAAPPAGAAAEEHAPRPDAPGGPANSNDAPENAAARPHWKQFVPHPLRESAMEPALDPALDSGQEPRTEGAPAGETSGGRAIAVAANGASRAAALASESGPESVRSNGGQARVREPAAKKPGPAPLSRAIGMPVEERGAPGYSIEMLGAEIEELRRMFERQQAGRAPLAPPSRELLGDTRLAALYHALIDNAVEPALASQLLAGLRQAAAQGADGKRLRALLAREMRARLKTNSELGGGASAVVALVGPSGAGKTTAVAKLAFRCGLLRRRPVRLFSVDQLRIGAVEPLQAYAELMNTPLEIIDDFDKLGHQLGAAAGAAGRPELLLIDTPGYGRREWERARRLAAAFQARGGVDVHLVVDLRTKTEDLRGTVDRFSMFCPGKLLFTRLDETATFGAMLNETVRSGLPLSYVSVGQRVPEDIVPAGEPELLKLLLRNRSTS
jgi:flagellar biosynthesis protein FlhF